MVAVRTGAALVAIGTVHSARMIAIADSCAGATLTANTVLVSGAPRPTVGAIVRVGEGAVVLDGLGVRIARYWPSAVRVVPIDPPALDDLPGGRAFGSTAATGLTAATVEPLFRALLAGSGLAGAARSLVGRGPGSTPAGDDVLAGVALGLRAEGRLSLLEDLRAVITPGLADRTSALSADLLRAALAGHASTEVLALVRTLRRGADPVDRRQAVHAVLRLGGTSGADLLLGLSGTLRLVSAPLLPTHSGRGHGR